jgi:hypothetical protein
VLGVERPHRARERIDHQPADESSKDDVADVPSVDPAIDLDGPRLIALLGEGDRVFLTIEVAGAGVERDGGRGGASIDLDAALVGNGDLPCEGSSAKAFTPLWERSCGTFGAQ